MSLISAYRVLKLGWHNYWRNRGLSISATLIMTLTLFIVTLFFLVNLVLAQVSVSLHDKINRMEVFFSDQATDEQIQTLQDQLAARADVREVHYISKEEAIEQFRQFRGVSDRIKQLPTTEQNVLPRSLKIRAGEPDQLAAISLFLANSEYQELIDYDNYQASGQETIPKLTSWGRAVTITGIILSAIFILISLIVVVSTIRLAIFARREEIEIMRLVGGSNIFIRLPFVIEGILYGLVAATAALGLTWLTVDNFGEFLNRYLSETPIDLTSLFLGRLPTLIVVELIVGLSVAILASLVSIQRYLKR